MDLNSRSRRTVLQPILLLSTLLSASLAQSTTTTTQTSSSITSNTPTTFLTSASASRNATAATSSSAYRPKGTDNAPNTFQGPDAAASFPSNSAQDANSDDSDDQRSGLLNYYFVFLALFVLLLFVGVYFIHKRKRARKMAFRNSGQNALARDLDGWTSSRRWIHGHRREESRVSGGEEGLNEYGEAPPPYIHAAKTPQNQEGEMEGSDIQIPLRTLSIHEFERPTTGKPPGYGEVVGEQTVGTVGEQAITSAPSMSNAVPPS